MKMKLTEIEKFIEVNRNLRKVLYFSISIYLLFSINLSSLSFASSGASFLKLGVGARPLSMGSAYTAVVNDATALHWNPGGLSRINRKEISFTHMELYADSRYDFLGYAMPITANRKKEKISTPSLTAHDSLFTLGIGAVYLSQGSMEGRSEDGAKNSDFEASDTAISLGIGKAMSQRYSLGINAKFIQSKIAGFSSTGYAFDFGLQSHLSSFRPYPIQFGFAVQNIGPKMKFINEKYRLPMTLSGGAGIKFFNALLISADLKHQPYDQKTILGFGTEFSPISALSLRAGYLANSRQQTTNSDAKNQISNLTGLGLGAGIKIRSMIIDYSFTPAGELGNKQIFSFNFQF